MEDSQCSSVPYSLKAAITKGNWLVSGSSYQKLPSCRRCFQCISFSILLEETNATSKLHWKWPDWSHMAQLPSGSQKMIASCHMWVSTLPVCLLEVTAPILNSCFLWRCLVPSQSSHSFDQRWSSITSSNKKQEEEQDSRFSGKCVPLWRSWKPRECWTWILLAWCLRVRLLGADKGLELQANWALSGKVGVAEANSWPNCAQNGLVVGWGSLLSPYTFCFVYLFSLYPFYLGWVFFCSPWKTISTSTLNHHPPCVKGPGSLPHCWAS